MIDATDLTKRFGDKVAVDNLTFTVRSGVVTGFLGPNGAGKSTTMRLILGLDHPTSGQTRVNGRMYQTTKAPMTEVGALLEAKSVHPGRTARNHLRALAATHGIPRRRVDEVIDLVGLGHVANKRVGQFSLGMGQRLGLAAALLGDPETLILDEPVNGLDPEGVAWVRNLLRYLAAEGRTVFISSHLMSEMALTADHIIIIGRGRLIADSPMSDLISQASGRVVKVRSPNATEIAEVVQQSGRQASLDADGSLLISGLTPEAIGREAARRSWILYELSPIQRSLEDVYMKLTDTALEFQAGLAAPGVVTPHDNSDVAPTQDTIDTASAQPAAKSRSTAPDDGPYEPLDASMYEPTQRLPQAEAAKMAQAAPPRSRPAQPQGTSRLEQVREARAALAAGKLTRTQPVPNPSSTRPSRSVFPPTPVTKAPVDLATSAQRLRDMSVLDRAYGPAGDARIPRVREPRSVPTLNPAQESDNATRRAWVREPRAVPLQDEARQPDSLPGTEPVRTGRSGASDGVARSLLDEPDLVPPSQTTGVPQAKPVRKSRGSSPAAPAREAGGGSRQTSARGSESDQRDEQENSVIHIPPLDLMPRMTGGLSLDQARATRPGSVYEQVMGFSDGPAPAPRDESDGAASKARHAIPPVVPGRESSDVPPAGSARRSSGVASSGSPRGSRGTSALDEMLQMGAGSRRSSTRASRGVATTDRARGADSGPGTEQVDEFHAISVDDRVMGLSDFPSLSSGRRSRDLPPVVTVSEPDGVSLVDPVRASGGSRRSRTGGPGAVPPVVSVSEPRVMTAVGDSRLGLPAASSLGSARTAPSASVPRSDTRPPRSAVPGSEDTSRPERTSRPRPHNSELLALSFDGRLSMPGPSRGPVSHGEFLDVPAAGSGRGTDRVPRPQRMRDFDAGLRQSQARVPGSAPAPRSGVRPTAASDQVRGSASASSAGRGRGSGASSQPESAEEPARTTRPRPAAASSAVPSVESIRARLGIRPDTDRSQQPGQAWRVRRSSGGQ